jgi:hypothetical protein
LVEHELPKLEVVGSNPMSRSGKQGVSLTRAPGQVAPGIAGRTSIAALGSRQSAFSLHGLAKEQRKLADHPGRGLLQHGDELDQGSRDLFNVVEVVDCV